MQKNNDSTAFVGKFILWRKEARTMYMSKLPNNLLSIPSGQQLKDAYKKFVVDHFTEENKRDFFHFINRV